MAKTRGPSKVAQASRYKTSRREESNRKKRLERELKRNPNNAAQIELAIKNIRHRRATPVTPFWSSTRKHTAQLFRRFAGRCDINIFSNNEKVSAPALMANTNLPRASFPDAFNMFKLKNVAHDNQGNLVWV